MTSVAGHAIAGGPVGSATMDFPSPNESVPVAADDDVQKARRSVLLVESSELGADKYASLLPELAEAEYRRLKETVITTGCTPPIIVDENNDILDGRHRYRICKEIGIIPTVQVRRGLTEQEKVEVVFSLNLDRRQVSKSKLRELRDRRLTNLLKLRQVMPRKWTYKAIANVLGVDESWVRKKDDGHIRKNPDVSKKDGRRHHDPRQVAECVRRVREEKSPITGVAKEMMVPTKVIQRAVKKAQDSEATLRLQSEDVSDLGEAAESSSLAVAGTLGEGHSRKRPDGIQLPMADLLREAFVTLGGIKDSETQRSTEQKWRIEGQKYFELCVPPLADPHHRSFVALENWVTMQTAADMARGVVEAALRSPRG